MAASDDWLVVDSHGVLGSTTEEQALTAIFGPYPGTEPEEERGLEEMLDASIEACGDPGFSERKRPTQRTLHDVIGEPKAKAKTCAHATSHSMGSASSSSGPGWSGRAFDFQRALAGLSGSNPTQHAEPVRNSDGPSQRVTGSALFEDEEGGRVVVHEDEDQITIFCGVPLPDM